MDLVRGWTVDQCVYSLESLPSMGMWVCFSNSSLTSHKNSGSSTSVFSLHVCLVPVTEKHLDLMLGATG